MKKIIYFLMILAVTLSMNFIAPTPSAAAEDAPFTVARLVVCKDVVDMEPVLGNEAKFPLAAGKVYCFLEARAIKTDCQVNFVWIHAGRELSTISLPMKKGHRWRTYANKKLWGLPGDWRVEIRASTGEVIDSVSFSVE